LPESFALCLLLLLLLLLLRQLRQTFLFFFLTFLVGRDTILLCSSALRFFLGLLLTFYSLFFRFRHRNALFFFRGFFPLLFLRFPDALGDFTFGDELFLLCPLPLGDLKR
jgi:signal transduction histidine kinase